jgi:hypothetical protein
LKQGREKGAAWNRLTQQVHAKGPEGIEERLAFGLIAWAEGDSTDGALLLRSEGEATWMKAFEKLGNGSSTTGGRMDSQGRAGFRRSSMVLRSFRSCSR